MRVILDEGRLRKIRRRCEALRGEMRVAVKVAVYVRWMLGPTLAEALDACGGLTPGEAVL